jgi:hypothetical protein
MVRPFQNGRAILTFGILADVGTGLLAGVARPQIHEWMLRVPEIIKGYVEGSGRSRYAR